MGAHKVKDLVRIGETYYFRKAIPKHLTIQFGIVEYKRSLRTKNPTIARRLCRIASNNFEQLIEFAETMPELKQAQLEEIARNRFQRLLENGNEFLYCLDHDDTLSKSEEAAGVAETEKTYREMNSAGKSPSYLKDDVLEDLKKFGHSDISVDSDSYRILLKYFMRGEIESRRTLRAKLMNEYENLTPQDPLFKGIVIDTLPEVSQGEDDNSASDDNLQHLTKKFLDVHEQVWAYKTILDYRRVMKWVCEFFGNDRLVHTFENKDIVAWRDLLIAIPSNYTKLGKDLSVVEAIKKYPKRKKIVGNTADKYMGFFKSFLFWCESEGYINSVPGQKVKIIHKEGDKPRLPFEQTELVNLFSSPMWTGYLSRSRRSKPGKYLKKDARYWIPLVALYTGLRCGEIIQLEFNDLLHKDGVDYFDINDKYQKTLKTKYSRRRVPIHPKLREWGFVEFIDTRKTDKVGARIFEEISISIQGDPSNAYSKFFSRYLTQIKLKRNDLSFHSTRHNFSDALDDAGVNEVHKKLLMGHSDQSASAQYGTGGKISVLYEQIKKISYDFEEAFSTSPAGIKMLPSK